MNKALLVAVAASLAVGGCGSDEPSDDGSNQVTSEERSGGSFFDREKERERENDENLKNLRDDLFGSTPNSAPSDGKDEGAQ